MSLVRPSLVLRMDLDERSFSEDMFDELKRSYLYAAPSVAVTHSGGEDERPENNLHFCIRLPRPYWDTADPKASALWDDVMPKWLSNMFAKVGSIMKNYNKVAHPAGSGKFYFDWLMLVFDNNAIIALRLDAQGGIPEQALEWVCEVRRLMNEGAWGDGAIAQVSIPSRASFDAQLEACLAELASQQDDEPVACACEAEDAEPFDGTDEDAVGTGECEDSDDQASVCYDQEPLPAFEIDYAEWGIQFVDGTEKRYRAF